MKIFYTSSEKDKKFGVSKVVNVLIKKLLENKIDVKFSNSFVDFLKFKPDIVHIHGCWQLHLFFIFIFCKLMSIYIIISPHGMIDPFSFSQKKFKKKIAWWLYQKFIFDNSNLIITNSILEKKNLQNAINKKLNIKVISHGIVTVKNYKFFKIKRKHLNFLFFSRLHHSKNLHNLINIWNTSTFYKKYNLDIYGNIVDLDYFKKIMKLIKNKKNIKYKGFLTSNIQNKLAKYDVFLHPSQSENFGLVILEALSSGLFPIINKNLDWKIIQKKGFGILIDFNHAQLKKSILMIEKNKKKLKSIIFRKKQLSFVKENYNWDKIMNEYLYAYLHSKN